MICKNPNCNNELKKGRRKYCSDKCQDKDYYKNNKEKYIERNKEWEKKNPEKYKEIHLKSNKKFRTEKRERFNKLMMKGYYRNKDKWNSRNHTYNILRQKRKKTTMIKQCKKCNATEDLRLKYEVYPTKADEIREAIKKGLIYYLCGRCKKNERRHT